MKRLRVAGLAEQDLDDIWHWIAIKSGSIEIANGVIDSITDTFTLFVGMPSAGTLREEIAPGVRGFPVGNYVIYYRESKRIVVIARVIPAKRDQAAADQNEPGN